MSLRLLYAEKEGSVSETSQAAMQSTWKTAVIGLVGEQAPSQRKALGLVLRTFPPKQAWKHRQRNRFSDHAIASQTKCTNRHAE